MILNNEEKMLELVYNVLLDVEKIFDDLLFDTETLESHDSVSVKDLEEQLKEVKKTIKIMEENNE